jgi:hypothetical protein
MKRRSVAIGGLVLGLVGCHVLTRDVEVDQASSKLAGDYDDATEAFAERTFDEGREVFRYDTFGSEAYWGDKLRLHEAILGEKQGGVGPGLTPKQALALGLKVDVEKLPRILGDAIRETAVMLENPQTTLALIKADAVVGVKGFFDEEGDLRSVGITCALCHSTVSNAFADGIGERLDGWPNRDLNVGAVVGLAPNLQAMASELGIELPELRRTIEAWGPGRYDAEFNQDGKGFRPDGSTAATVLPAAFGLAGVNLHTYGGWGGIAHWNAYVAVTQMHGQGTFFDPRLDDPEKYPLAARTGAANVRPAVDRVTPKLAALNYYQLSLPAPRPEAGSYDAEAAERGRGVFASKARCYQCHVPPTFTEPGWGMHTPEELGIDSFQADRQPYGRLRTTPLAGLFTRAKGGFYHDGRFPTLEAVVDHYQRHFKLELTDAERRDLVEYLRSL